MSTVTYALCTNQKVKDYLGLTETDFDVVIDDLIDRCTDWIETICARRFKDAASDITEYHDGGLPNRPRTKLFLKRYPINAVTSIAYRSGDYNNPTWNIYNAASDFIRVNNSGIIQFVFPFPAGTQNIRVIYQGGYTTIPNDLEHLCIKLVAKEFQKRKSQGVDTESIGGASISWTQDFDPEVKRILNSYRAVSV